MKYKIKVVVMQDGVSYFYPMVKEHWFTPWMFIRGNYTSSFFLDSSWTRCNTREAAERLIESYRKTQISNIYDIPYKDKKE